MGDQIIMCFKDAEKILPVAIAAQELALAGVVCFSSTDERSAMPDMAVPKIRNFKFLVPG